MIMEKQNKIKQHKEQQQHNSQMIKHNNQLMPEQVM